MIVVSTNNRSYQRSGNSEQHLALGQMRAAETGRAVLQASVSGISAVIDPDGDVHDETELFESAIVSASVPTSTGETLYVRFGDWVVLLGAVAMVVVTVLAIRRPVSVVQQSLTAATSPTTTIRPRSTGTREPPADGRTELRADHRADRDEHDDEPGDVGEEHEEDRGDAVGDEREHVLHRVEPLQGVGDEDPEQRRAGSRPGRRRSSRRRCR